MDAIVPVFIAVLLAETGGIVQHAAHHLGHQFKGSAKTVIALAIATVISLAVGAIGGRLVATMVTFEARTLLAGLALVFAGVPMLFRVKGERDLATTRPFFTSLLRFVRVQFADASQFIVFAFAARANAPELTLAAGFAAVMVAAVPPIILFIEWPFAMPLAILRKIAAIMLTFAGLWLGVIALRLI